MSGFEPGETYFETFLKLSEAHVVTFRLDWAQILDLNLGLIFKMGVQL
jgi:hypothetical protein